MTGTVTGTSGTGLARMCIGVSDDTGTLAGDETDAQGRYTISGLPAGKALTVEFHDCDTGAYTHQWYKGATNPSQATPVYVPDGGTLTGIDANMQRAVRISGTVTDESGAPLQNVCVFVSNQQQTDGEGNVTDANGNYNAGGLPPGTYWVEFDQGCYSPGAYAKQWYDGASSVDQATLLTGSAGQTFTGIDGRLVRTQSEPPAVTSVSPNSGPTSGGSYVTITGNNFGSDAAVSFGSHGFVHPSQATNTQLTVVAPAGSAGTVDVTVSTPAGTSAVTPDDQFTYDPSQPALVPSITSVAPTEGTTQGGDWVTIYGENLAGDAGVMFGDAEAPESQAISNNEVRARTPSHDVGTVDITVNTYPLGPTAQTPADRYTFSTQPDPQLPEAPLPLLVPVAGIVAAGLIYRRRRRTKRSDTNSAI